MQTRNRFWVSHVFLVWWYFLFLEIFSGRKRSLCVTYLSIYDKCIFFLSDCSWSPSTEHKVSQVLNWSENLSFRWGKKSCILSDVSSRISCFFPIWDTNKYDLTWQQAKQSKDWSFSLSELLQWWLFSAESEVKNGKLLWAFFIGFSRNGSSYECSLYEYKQAFATQAVKFLEYRDGYWRIGLSFYIQ